MTPSGSGARRVLALAVAGVAGVTIFQFARDLSLRTEAERLAAASLARESSEDVALLRQEPSGDLAVSAAVRILVSASEKSEPAAETRAGTWDRARSLLLESIRRRPGWPHHLLLLGRVDLRAPDRASPAARLGRSLAALRLAVASAPGLEAAWSALGETLLSSWSDLPAQAREEASRQLRESFRAPGFVSGRFEDAVAVFGAAKASALLPDDDAEALETATRILAEKSDIPGAAALAMRTDAAERLERSQDLLELDSRRRLGDVAGLRTGCAVWFRRHRYWEFDDPAGRAQVARLLEIWPNDRPGSWTRDRRAELVRFFLEGREADVRADILLKTAQALTGVPDSVLARIFLLVGDRSAAQSLAGRAPSPRPADWDLYFLQAARYEISHGTPARAREALQGLSTSARADCDGLVLARELAVRTADVEETRRIDRALDSLPAPDPSDWSHGSASLCLDPARTAGKELTVEVSGSPVLLSYGWDHGRRGLIWVPEKRTGFRVPLPGLEGRHRVWISILMGGVGSSLRGSLAPSS